MVHSCGCAMSKRAKIGGAPTCGTCGQQEGDQDQDCPDGYEKAVYFSKPGSTECGACLNNRRGTFGIDLKKLLKLIADHDKVADAWAASRKEAVERSVLQPERKMKYDKADIELLSRKEEQDYIDIWQDFVWKSLEKVCNEKWPGNKFKTDSQRKKYVCDVLKMDIALNHEGREGVNILVGAADEARVRKGMRLQASKIKDTRHDSLEDRDAAHEKLASKLSMEGVTEKDLQKRADAHLESSAESDSSSDSDSSSSSDEGFSNLVAKAKPKARGGKGGRRGKFAAPRASPSAALSAQDAGVKPGGSKGNRALPTATTSAPPQRRGEVVSKAVSAAASVADAGAAAIEQSATEGGSDAGHDEAGGAPGAPRDAADRKSAKPTLQLVTKELDELSPQALWQNTYAPREVNARVSRASMVLADIDGDEKSALEARIMKVSALSANFRKIRDSSNTVCDPIADFEEDVLLQIRDLSIPMVKLYYSTVVKKIPEDLALLVIVQILYITSSVVGLALLP